MTTRITSLCALLTLLLVVAAPSHAAPFLGSTDAIIAIDTDAAVLPSDYPGAEYPGGAGDGDTGTKYLNFAKTNSGFIVEPFIGSTIVQSLQMTTANDDERRDPLNWELYGTNDLITSVDNGDGSAENWTLIAAQDALLPVGREIAGPVQSFSNTTSYAAYRILFPTVKDLDANSMQVAEVGLFESTDASGFSVWEEADNPIAFAYEQPDSSYPSGENPTFLLDGGAFLDNANSDYPAAEGPGNVVDGTVAKYLNGGDYQSGFIVTPASASTMQSFQLTTANDNEDRDPASWAVYGTNDAIASADNSFGFDESWTLIDSGLFEGGTVLPTDRDTPAPVVSVTNSTSYSSYKMIFPTLKGAAGGAMQIAEAAFYSTTDGTGGNILSPSDAVLAVDESVTLTKYLNFGGENSGFIVTPDSGSKTLTGFEITTANDFETRDPASFELYGTNDVVTTDDNGQGTEQVWTLIAADDLTLPTERDTAGGLISVANATAYTSYKMVFPTLKDPGENNDNSMQIAGIQFFDDSTAVDVDLNDDGIVDGADLLLIQRTNPSLTAEWQVQFGGAPLASASVQGVPEPSSVLLALGAVVAGFVARKRLGAC